MLPKHCLRTGTVLFAVVATMAAHACLNDRDTLAEEVKVKPDLLWTIVGRFERNSARYYQMRIERETAQLKANPLQPDLYDDVAVAYDRIHQYDQAIAWMNKKRAVLRQLGRTEATNPMDWYRINANEGTFIVHRLLTSGKKSSSELKRGRDMIAKALVLNPDAHFGREGTQLEVMNWMLDDPKGDNSLANYLSEHAKDSAGKLLTNDQIVDALSGLVRLGAAWESPVIFGAIADLQFDYETDNLSGIAASRVRELVKGNNKRLATYARISGEDIQESAASAYTKYRAEAETWHEHRVAYMDSQFKLGKHPDTDPNFWAGYKETPAPEIEPAGLVKSGRLVDLIPTIVAVLGAGLLIAAAGLTIVFRRRLLT